MNKEKRLEIEKFILDFAKEITPGGGNYPVYKGLFEKFNDKQFDTFWESIKERGYVPVFVDNQNNKEMLDIDIINKLAERDGIPLMQHITMTDPDSGITFTTPNKVPVGISPVTKKRQIISKKFTGAKNDTNVEDLTGQAMGESRAGGISTHEVDVLIALGLPTMAKELTSVLGGDKGAYDQYKSEILATGNTSVSSALKSGTGVKSLQTLHYLFLGQHIENNFDER